MKEIIEYLKGKKAYLIAIATAVLGTLQGLDVFTLPEWVWPILAACGLAALRAGVNKVADGIKPK